MSERTLHIGLLGLGRLIKYMPYPVVSGYLNGGTSDQASFWGIGVPAGQS